MSLQEVGSVLSILQMRKLRSGLRSQDSLKRHISFYTFSFISPFPPSFPTTHSVHRHCSSQNSHSLGVRYGLGIKKWMSTLLSPSLGCIRHAMLHACFSHGHPAEQPQRPGLPKPLQVTRAGKAPIPLGFSSKNLPPSRPAEAGSPQRPLLQPDSVSSHLLPTLLELFFLPH